MKFLIDKVASDVERKASASELVAGQLLTPLTRYANWGGVFAIDNGAFAGFNAKAFKSLVNRNVEHKANCLFVTIPDIVANARRTLELWRHRYEFAPGNWPIAFVSQDGIEDMDIPWCDFQCLFVGGGDPWKDSLASQDIVKTAKALGKHVHIGRVNTIRRYEIFAGLGADTCDGSGVAKYDHMIEAIDAYVNSTEHQAELFDAESVCDDSPC